MDAQTTSKHLHHRINTDVTQLLQRFENIIAPARGDGTDNIHTAVAAYNMNVEASALTRAAEDILSLTRSMKEAWLFGKLHTIGEDEHESKRDQELEENVKFVGQALEAGLSAQSAANMNESGAR